MIRTKWVVLAAALAAMGCEEREAGLEERTELGERQEGRPLVQEPEQREEAQRDQAQREQLAQREQGVVDQQAGQQQEGQQPVQQSAQIMVRTQQPYGQHLTDSNGRPLYIFTADTRRQSSNCNDQCAQAWQPVLTQQAPRGAHQSIQEDMLDSIRRRDGSQQVTYNGWPLYTYVQDRTGQIAGQGQSGFNGEWYLMAPTGERIETSPDQRQAQAQR